MTDKIRVTSVMGVAFRKGSPPTIIAVGYAVGSSHREKVGARPDCRQIASRKTFVLQRTPTQLLAST